MHTIKKLHGCKGVTSIQLIGDTIISTGRDGFYRQLSVNEESIKVLDSNKLQLDWIAKIEETHSLGAVLVGFHDVSGIMIFMLILYLFHIKCGTYLKILKILLKRSLIAVD